MRWCTVWLPSHSRSFTVSCVFPKRAGACDKVDDREENVYPRANDDDPYAKSPRDITVGDKDSGFVGDETPGLGHYPTYYG